MFSCRMEEWVFAMGFLSHSAISSIGVGETWEDELGACYTNFSALQPFLGGILCVDFSTLQPLRGGILWIDFLALRPLWGGNLYETWKGRGQGTNRVLGSSSKNIGALWFVRVKEEGKSGGSPCQETWTKRFNSWLMKSRFTNHSGISWQRWRKWVEKLSTDSPGFILKGEILSYTSWWLRLSNAWWRSLMKVRREWIEASGRVWHH